MTVSINQVVENLKTTIAGKEAYLAKLREDVVKYDQVVGYATAKFLEININELKVILNDVNKACEEHSLAMWEINPERMGQ